MAQFTQWDLDLEGPGQWTGWDDTSGGPGETQWDLAPDVIGDGQRIRWIDPGRMLRWVDPGRRIKWLSVALSWLTIPRIARSAWAVLLPERRTAFTRI